MRDEPVAAERDQPIFGRAPQEHVAREEGNDRFDPPSLRRAALLLRLRKVVGDPRFAQLAGDRLLLAGLGVQAPPGRPVIRAGWTHRFPRDQGGSSRARAEEWASRRQRSGFAGRLAAEAVPN